MKVLAVKESHPPFIRFLHCGVERTIEGFDIPSIVKHLSKNFGEFDTRAEIRADVELVISEQRAGLREVPSSTQS
jgi:hypothetical protein